MERREYLAAVTTLLSASAGCASTDTTMTQEEAKAEFDDVTEFDVPVDFKDQGALRCVDREAGVVIYGMTNESINGEGIGISVIPLDQTDL